MTQAIGALAVALAAIVLLAAMSLRANRRFRTERRLPMQWLLDGSVTWTAPRHVALAFTPGLAAVALGGVAAATTFLTPRPGQEHLVVPANILIALTFVGAHALHLRLIQRSLQRRL